MGWVSNCTPRLRHRATESSTEPLDEKREGMVMPTTFSGPSAWAANASVSALSMPPELPTTTCLKPQRRA
ncbi:hypothetical protein D3C87_2168740 [compost metagenome]